MSIARDTMYATSSLCSSFDDRFCKHQGSGKKVGNGCFQNDIFEIFPNVLKLEPSGSAEALDDQLD